MNEIITDVETIGLLSDVKKYAEEHKGKIYAPIDHPLFMDIPHHHGADRFDALVPFLPKNRCNCLDIGTHWGYLAHRLEECGHTVTAAEINKNFLLYLYRIRRLYGDSFSIWPKSVFDIPNPAQFELIFALNIFHHFTKEKAIYDVFIKFLSSIDCNTMFFQSHNPAEGQMEGAYKNYSPDEFVDLIIQSTTMTRASKLFDYRGRTMYRIEK